MHPFLSTFKCVNSSCKRSFSCLSTLKQHVLRCDINNALTKKVPNNIFFTTKYKNNTITGISKQSKTIAIKKKNHKKQLYLQYNVKIF